MFEKLFELLVLVWANVKPAVVLNPYEGGVVLRLGLWHRTIGPGFHWKWPLFEYVLEATTCVTTTRLPAQTLTTKDGKSVVVAAIIKYEIRDVKPYLLDIFDQNDVLVDVVMGAVRAAIAEVDWAATFTAPPEKSIVEQVRARVNRYGFSVQAITFTDLGVVRSIRLIQPHAKDLAN